MGNFLRAASDDCESLPFERDLTELGLDRNDPAAPAIAYISRLHGYKGAEQAAQIAARFNYLNEHEPETTYILSREMYRVPGEHTLHIRGMHIKRQSRHNKALILPVEHWRVFLLARKLN